jgi:hypothetical protein
VTTRDRSVILVLVAAAAVAAFWFGVFAPKRSEAAKLSTQLAALHKQEDSARNDVIAGEAARRGYPANYALIARLGEAVPADDNEPSLVFQLDSAAKRSGVDFRALKLQAAATGAAPGASSGGGASATQSAAATLPPGAAVGPAGFPTMPFSLTFDGNFFHMSDFFRRLEGFVKLHGQQVQVGGRLLAINGLALTSSRHGFPAVKASVAANAYLTPDAEGATAGATPSAPASKPSTPAKGATGAPSASPATAIAPTR